MLIATMALLVVALVPLSRLREAGARDRRLQRPGSDRRGDGVNGLPSETRVLYSVDRWRAALTRRRHRPRRPIGPATEGLVTSNVSQNYPYTSETEAERAGRIAALVAERDGLADTLAAETTPLDANERWWVWKCPTQRLPRPPPCGGLRAREARRLRRLRRDLRQDVPALTAAPARRGRREPATPRHRSGIGIAVSAVGFGFVYGLAAREAGFSPIEAMAMSVIVFAGAAQFAAVGYVAGGLPWLGDRAADRAAQRPAPAVLRGAVAVAA